MATLTQLQYIVTLDRLRHFGKTAKACAVSQPSLSMQIQKVEDEIGYFLFDRTKKPLIPTAKGLRFIHQAQVLLREHQKLMGMAQQDSKEISGELNLGMIPTLAPYVLPLFLENFSAHFPKIDLNIEELKTETLIEKIQRDELDAAILATPLHEKGIQERVLFYEPFHVYCGLNSSLRKKIKISEEDLDPNHLWLLKDGHCFRNQVVRICSLDGPLTRDGTFHNIAFEAGTFETLRNLIRHTETYTLIPWLFRETLPPDERRNQVRDFEGPTPMREISLVHRRDQWKSDLIQALQTSIEEMIPAKLKLIRPKSQKQKIEI